MTWLLLGVILTSVYSSQLTSSLTVSSQALPFTSLTQLLNQETYTWGVSRGTAQESLFKVRLTGLLQVRHGCTDYRLKW